MGVSFQAGGRAREVPLSADKQRRGTAKRHPVHLRGDKHRREVQRSLEVQPNDKRMELHPRPRVNRMRKIYQIVTVGPFDGAVQEQDIYIWWDTIADP